MADIFLATRRVDGGEDLCVIKMMIPSTLRKPRALNLFLGEARLAALLEHENVVRILDRDRVDDYYFIAMEYLAGETLYHLLYQATREDKTIQPAVAAAITAQACHGLSCAHSMCDPAGQPLNIVHRDVSPSNLILTYDGVVKVLDFGIAAADTRRLKFPKGKAIGKYGYMSPEQCRGSEVDQRSDIFSLGVVFWELLTGTNLFPGADPKAIMKEIVSGEIPSPRSTRAEGPAALESIAMRALSNAPRDRFEDARSMAAALAETAVEQGLPSESALAGVMEDLFGTERVEASRAGEVGEELELATLLFDDLDAEPPVRKEQKNRSKRGRRVISPTALILLGVLIVLLTSALGVIAWVESLPPKKPAPTTEPTKPRGAIMVDSTPNGARILIDEFFTGHTTPAELTDLPIGVELQIRISRKGYEDWSSRVLLEDTETRRVNVMLQANPIPVPPREKKHPKRKRRKRR